MVRAGGKFRGLLGFLRKIPEFPKIGPVAAKSL